MCRGNKYLIMKTIPCWPNPRLGEGEWIIRYSAVTRGVTFHVQERESEHVDINEDLKTREREKESTKHDEIEYQVEHDIGS